MLEAKWIALRTTSRLATDFAQEPVVQLSTDMEIETALRGVRIDGEHMPRDRLRPCWQSPNTDAHHVAADALALVHTRPRRITYFCLTEFRFELLREVERDLP